VQTAEKEKPMTDKLPVLRVADWKRLTGAEQALAPVVESKLLKLHAAMNVDEFWRATVRLLDAVLPNRWVGVCLQNIQLLRPMILLASGGIRRTTEYWMRHFQLCPAGPLFQAHPELQMLRISDQLDGLDWYQTEFYRTYMQDQDVEYAAILVFRKESQLLGTVSVQRNRKQGDLTGAEMGLLARLYPHFEVAIQRLLRVDAELTAERAVKQLWDRLPVPVVLLDWDLDPLYCNPAARDLCVLWNLGGPAARSLSSRKVFALPSVLRETCLGLKAHWRSSRGAGEAGTHLLRSIDHPGMPELRGHIFLEEIQSLSGGKPVFLLELERRRGRRIPQLHDGPGRLAQLSPKERELITLLCQGRRNAEIAKQLHLSVGTVKRELNLIYQKLRVQSRNQLIARLR
jgi:DNA-binding CsgD family transcriptional regulator/PAS domain-containing protein